jgi:hypothetical protein
VHTVLIGGCAYAAPEKDEKKATETLGPVFNSHPGRTRIRLR